MEISTSNLRITDSEEVSTSWGNKYQQKYQLTTNDQKLFIAIKLFELKFQPRIYHAFKLNNTYAFTEFFLPIEEISLTTRIELIRMFRLLIPSISLAIAKDLSEFFFNWQEKLREAKAKENLDFGDYTFVQKFKDIYGITTIFYARGYCFAVRENQ